MIVGICLSPFVLSPLSMRGGKTWFALEAKSFDIEIKEYCEKLKGCMRERCKGVTSWIRFGDMGLQNLLSGLEECGKAY